MRCPSCAIDADPTSALCPRCNTPLSAPEPSPGFLADPPATRAPRPPRPATPQDTAPLATRPATPQDTAPLATRPATRPATPQDTAPLATRPAAPREDAVPFAAVAPEGA